MFSFEIQSRKEIHVANISASNANDKEEIIEKFEKFGTIELDQSFKKKFSLRKVSETSLCAWITYTHDGSVKEAGQEMDGKLFDGKHLKVSPAFTGLAQPRSSSDWECLHCQGINFHWQSSCFRCRELSPRADHLREPGYCQRQESQLRRRSPGRQERGRESPRAEGVWRKEQHQDRSRSRPERARSTLRSRSRSRSREESRQGISRQSNSDTDSQRIEDIKEDFVKNMRRYEKRPFFFYIKVCSRSPNQDFFRMEFDDSLNDVQEMKETTTKDLLHVVKSVAIDSDEKVQTKMDNNNQMMTDDLKECEVEYKIAVNKIKKYMFEEDKKIIHTVLEHLGDNYLPLYEIPSSPLKKLSELLQRRETSTQGRWKLLRNWIGESSNEGRAKWNSLCKSSINRRVAITCYYDQMKKGI